MHAVEVHYDTRTIKNGGYIPEGSPEYPIDLTKVPTANDAASSQAASFQRAAAITLHNACLPLLPYTAYRHEEDYTYIILAKLDYANYYQRDECPGRGISNRQEAFESLKRQKIDSRVGTTIDDISLFEHLIGAYRTGEYDVALSGYIQVIDRFGGILPRDVYNHILNDLLNKRGLLDLGDHSVDIGFPESENHINLIESSRYLTNDLLYARSGDAQYDNSRNSILVAADAFGYETEQVPPSEVGCPGCPVLVSMRDYWLRRLHHILQTDFIEYNARPYQGYSMRAIQNLYSYAKDTDPVKAAAGLVLEYISAKLAASSNDDRRAVPYRRKAGYNDPHLIGFHADPQSVRMLALAGDLSILKQTPRSDFYAPWYGRPDMEMAILSSYRIPYFILDSMMNPKHRIFYQSLHHYADELYAASPRFLISAGGHYATYAYTILGLGQHDDIGLALPTTVMPTGVSILRDDLIRFEGDSDDTKRSNMCVAPNFACGINPILPEMMNPDSQSYALQRGCAVKSGPWTFIDFTQGCRTDNDESPAGFYAALYQFGGRSLLGEKIKTGFVEVFDTQINPNVNFVDFTNHVIAANGNRHYHAFLTHNVYVTITGQKIDFELAPDSRILRITNGPAPVQSTTDMATGTIIESSGTSGLITITNPYLGSQLTLDDSDPYNPQEYERPIPSYSTDTCLTGFVWRLADPSDHVCVTRAQFHLTRGENKVAFTHTVRRTTDTCKQNYVWRLADPTDHICVQQSSYDQAQWDNKLALSRLAAPLP